MSAPGLPRFADGGAARDEAARGRADAGGAGPLRRDPAQREAWLDARAAPGLLELDQPRPAEIRRRPQLPAVPGHGAARRGRDALGRRAQGAGAGAEGVADASDAEGEEAAPVRSQLADGGHRPGPVAGRPRPLVRKAAAPHSKPRSASSGTASTTRAAPPAATSPAS